MGKIRAVERTEVEVAMEVEAETARGQEAETEVEQETEQAADAEPDRRGTHDYVSVPNKLGNDSSITKDKGDSKNSDYYKAKNGLAWKGEHVDLDSVVGDYTKEAYEGIANGKYPAGMEDVIRNYFENLN